MRCKKVQISITAALAYENDVFSLAVFFIKQPYSVGLVGDFGEVGIVEEVEGGGEGEPWGRPVRTLNTTGHRLLGNSFWSLQIGEVDDWFA
jgi:hypothetical protein